VSEGLGSSINAFGWSLTSVADVGACVTRLNRTGIGYVVATPLTVAELAQGAALPHSTDLFRAILIMQSWGNPRLLEHCGGVTCHWHRPARGRT